MECVGTIHLARLLPETVSPWRSASNCEYAMSTERRIDDPYLQPSMSLRNRIGRALWMLVWAVLFWPSPRSLHSWRRFLLRRFGATIGRRCRIYPGATIWAPWNLVCEDVVAIGNGAEIYNPRPIILGSHAIVSQRAYLCGASHDYNDPAFPMIYKPIQIGAYAWIGARAIVMMGVNVGDGAVLGTGSIATRDLEPWGVYAGIPARKINTRTWPTPKLD